MIHYEFKNNKDIIVGVIISLSLGDQAPLSTIVII